MIYKGENKTVLCKGDFHPAQLYKGDKKIAGYNVEEFESENGVTLESCYNDKLHDAQIIGNTMQDGTPTPEAPVEIKSVGELVTEGEYTGKYKIPVRARGKNLFDLGSATRGADNCTDVSYENGVWYGKGKETIPENWNAIWGAGQLSIKFPKINTTNKKVIISMYYTLLEEPSSVGAPSMYCFYTGDSANYARYSEAAQSFPPIGERKRLVFSRTLNFDMSIFTMRLGGGRWAVELDTLQIEIGDKVSPYEPYIEPQTFNIYLDEPLRKVGDYADYVNFDKSMVVRSVKNKVFDGTEKWENHETKNLLFRETNVIAFEGRTHQNKIQAISNYLTSRTWISLYQNYYKEDGNLMTGVALANNASSKERYIFINFYSTSITTDEMKAQIKAWYEDGNPFTVWYAIPTTEEPIELPELPTFKGTTIYEINTQIPATVSGKYKKLD